MVVVVGADRNGVKLGVIENFAVVVNSLSAAVGFNSLVGSFGDNIAEIFYLAVLRRHICRNVCAVCDITAAYDCNSYLVFHSFVLLCIMYIYNINSD